MSTIQNLVSTAAQVIPPPSKDQASVDQWVNKAQAGEITDIAELSVLFSFLFFFFLPTKQSTHLIFSC